MNVRHMNDTLKDLCNLYGCFAEDLKGLTFRELLEGADRFGGAVVFWSCWSDSALEMIPVDGPCENI